MSTYRPGQEESSGRITAPKKTKRRIAFLGTYAPRRCGIATFTQDLSRAVSAREDLHASIVAINDTTAGYDYPDEVEFEISQNVLQDYRQAADFVNIGRFGAVCVQHEYGIFGGDDGRHVLRLLGQLRMPVITTLHTILREPSASQRAVVKELSELSDRLVTMTETGRLFLCEQYGVPDEAIAVIPHGIPDVPFVDPNFYKDHFGVEGKKVVLTFGLLSPSKGIEYAIQALPKIAERHPDVVYIVVGATHPHVHKAQGEAYRHQLRGLACSMGVDDRVVFHDQYVDIDRLCAFLGAADVYVTPYLNEEQITSGTLVYAMGAGKAVVSTPYWHAKEALAEGRGTTIPFRDSEVLARAIIDLFDRETDRHQMRKSAYSYTRNSTWPAVAERYAHLIDEILDLRRKMPRVLFTARTERHHGTRVPTIDLQHLLRMTDDTGMFQHAVHTVPDREHGYCTDDNARALIVAVMARGHLEEPGAVDVLTTRYLSFLCHAFDRSQKVFRNFLGFDRHWLEKKGSPDSQGRAMWALGVAASQLNDVHQRTVATAIFQEALSGLEGLEDLRAMAFAVLGLDAYLRRLCGDSVAKRMRLLLAEKLMAKWVKCTSDTSWPWPETTLTYANARLPHALIVSGVGLGDSDMVQAGLRSLDWLVNVQTAGEHFSPIGNRGWYPKDGEKARFDQQPIEADATIAACIATYNATRERRWINETVRAFRWFLGENDLGSPLYDPASGGCRDGLTPMEANENQGAESTLAWLSTVVQLHELQANAEMGWTREVKQQAVRRKGCRVSDQGRAWL